MTTVTCMLAWYDEDPATLYRAVSSAACIADRIAAADGRWDLYPGQHAKSPPDQYDAIRDAAQDAGLDLAIEHRDHWTGQVQKRNHLLRMAQPATWLMPLDADWELNGDRAHIRPQLENAEADALIVAFHTPPNPDATLRDVAATAWHEQLAGHTIHEPLIYRNLPGIRIDNYHWHYSAIKHGQRVALWGTHHPPCHTHPITGLRIDHHCLHRDQRTIQANRRYCHLRDQHVAMHGREP